VCVGDLAAGESEEEEEGRSEELADEADKCVVGPFWEDAAERWEAFAKRRVGVLCGRLGQS
jgi:hypothetical protein